MDALRFDRLARSLSRAPSRRGVLRGLATLALTAVGLPGALDARKKRKKKRKKKQKLKKNEFGCVNVGGRCQGNDANCCSGICEGRKPKQGKRDKSRCVAHDVADCPAGVDTCSGENPMCPNGACWQTTGRAVYCGMAKLCEPCQKDVDCELAYGPGAACIICEESCADVGGATCAGLT
jgi:hypothetical protein